MARSHLVNGSGLNESRLQGLKPPLPVQLIVAAKAATPKTHLRGGFELFVGDDDVLKAGRHSVQLA